ncbi:MAG: S8 family serine peptidase, partial [Chitinophagaceae bacterium]
MIKKLSIVFVGILFFILPGCKDKNQDARYSVSGTIKNAANKPLLLQEIPYGGKPIVTLDSITLDANGKYNFEFIAKQEGIYRLSSGEELDISFINDEEQIQINADATNFASYTVKGSPHSAAMIEYMKAYRSKDSSLFATLYALDNLQQSNGKDSTIFYLQQQKEKKIKALNDHVENTINSSNSPALIYFALGMALRSMEINKVLAMAKGVAEKTKAEPLLEFVTILSGQVQESASPATAITVGATTLADAPAGYSNQGKCVDIFAPGSGILSAWFGAPDLTREASGTSMASPHVAGAAAIYLGLNPTASVAQVAQYLDAESSKDVITGVKAETVNKLLYVSPTDGGAPIVPPVVAQKTVTNITHQAADVLIDVQDWVAVCFDTP